MREIAIFTRTIERQFNVLFTSRIYELYFILTFAFVTIVATPISSAYGAELVSDLDEFGVTAGGHTVLVSGVANSDAINVRLGKVSKATARTFILDLYGDDLIQLSIGSQTAHQKAQTGGGQGLIVDPKQLDEIYAEGGVLALSIQTARDALDNVINMSGVFQAQTGLNDRGEIVLRGGEKGIVNIAGTPDASGWDSGETGGTMKILGDKISLFERSVINGNGESADVDGNSRAWVPNPMRISCSPATRSQCSTDRDGETIRHEIAERSMQQTSGTSNTRTLATNSPDLSRVINQIGNLNHSDSPNQRFR